ncbi:hypothetical protein VB712_08210 [Spirulina sp. CCNP1310]|uniref:hypothetical protein n=1 Tax=Spirulina sp. CCNP1310 TaxID=3110249 RepID=UPI002B1EF2D3|nr:hypothetical protein [Spirulina sp. CCNP1310]MEA5419212.1 hypothetical protein [Spirulina sp. CCNP1310]
MALFSLLNLKSTNPQPTAPISMRQRLWGSTLVVIGYLLSPLCWWNDLIINLPLALGFGYLFSRPYPDAFIPLTALGYWLSNVIGFMLIQQGSLTALSHQSQNFRQGLRNGLLTATLYTAAIALLLQCHLLETPTALLDGDLWQSLSAILPIHGGTELPTQS